MLQKGIYLENRSIMLGKQDKFELYSVDIWLRLTFKTKAGELF